MQQEPEIDKIQESNHEIERLKQELEDARDLLEIHRQYRENLDLPARKRIAERKLADEKYSLACRELGIGEQSTDSGDTLLEAVAG